MEHNDSQQNAANDVVALRAELEAAQRLADRLRQEALAAERAKNEFLANISHEIRTPMNAILGFCRMLLKEPLEPAHIEKLEYVHDAAESLLELMSNVLNYSRLAAGELKLSHTPFELDAVVRAVMVATRDPARHKGLTIDYFVEDSVPYWLRGDQRRLGQVLGNLVSNALKFTERGEIHVRVSLDESHETDAVIRFVISDTGVGIPPERQQVIFDAFAQADGSSTRRFGGLGLGLSICKQLVDLMNGQIGFRSILGSGSSFWFTIPMQVYSGTKAAAPDENDRADRAGRTGQFGLTRREQLSDRGYGKGAKRFHILTADDDYLSRTLVEMLLGRVGCLVDTATNGREAIMLAAQSQYDLVLMDLQMPELDGISAIRKIRSNGSGLNRKTPIVALTAHSVSSDRRRCLEAGADEFLTKPISPDGLLAVVGRFLPGCLETFEERPRSEASGPRPDPPHLLQECFQAICRALGERDFARLEVSAGQLKNVSLGAGGGPVADHAMRVQFAARSSDLEEATNAVERLHSLLEAPYLENPREPRLTGERS